MNKTELTLLNLGESLDNIANLDPRGYGVCRLLYRASREFTGRPLCLNAAERLIETLNKNDTVFFLTGFVLYPFAKAETDGAIGSALLANALEKGIGAKSVIICPEDAENGIRAVCDYLCCNVDIITFTKEKSDAEYQSDKLISEYNPKAVIAVECPGEDKDGRYHNARGVDVTDLQAKQDVLFDKLKEKGVLNIAIGDLGNEIGMSAIADCLDRDIPVVHARTVTDNIITSTVSDWGCYSLVAMLAYMLDKSDLMHGGDTQVKVMNISCNNGLIDMNGGHIPAIDGLGEGITSAVVTMMKEVIESTVNHRNSCDYWFDRIKG